MAIPRSITSANSQLTLSIAGVYNTPVAIQGYAADGGFSTENIKSAETMMGMDGQMSAGFVFNEIKFKITLNANSPSKIIFDDWFNFSQGQREVAFCQGQLVLPATGETYTLTNGVLSGYAANPAGKKVLSPVEYELVFESISKA